jgi:glycosyltransferase involved in cell wall biosynthesis
MAVETVRALKEAGHDVVAAVPETGPLVRAFADVGARVVVRQTPVLRKEYLNPIGLIRLAGSAIGALGGQLKLMRTLGITTVWANTLTQPTWLAAARLSRLEIVCHVREAENDRPSIVKSALAAPLRLAHEVVTNSIATREFLLATRGGPRPERVRVIYNGKDWAPYFRSEPRLHRPVLRLLVVGRLNPRKGQDTAIRALADARARGIPAHLTLAGDVFPGYEWYEESLADLAKELGVGEHVEFLGFINEVADVLAEADIVIVPSRVEPFGTVAAEAMAAMRPVIVAATEGLKEIVDADDIGMRFPPEDVQALADAIEHLHASSEVSARMARAGYESVSTRFSKASYARQIIDVLATDGVARDS